jgi:hypothetical protein
MIVVNNQGLSFRGHTTRDGMLNLSFHVGLPDLDVTVTVNVQPATKVDGLDANGWPVGYFEQVVGSMPELERGPQGSFETRLSLE